MDVVFYNFSKKINSTKKPTGGTTVSCTLKENTSTEAPTLQVNIDISAISGFTYAYIPTFGNYYYVNNINCITNTLVEISLVVDVLATYKSNILSTMCYVEYADNDTYYNNLIPDKRVSMTNNLVQSTVFTDSIFEGGGCYILGVAGESENAQIGFINYYAMSATSAHQLAQSLYTDDIRSELDKYFNSPFDAIIEAHWIPWTITGTLTGISLGGYQTGILGVGLSSEIAPGTTEISMNIPWIDNDWRDFNNTKLELYLPFYGVVELDTNTLQDNTTISIYITKDALSGELCYTVVCGAWKSSYRVDISVPLAVGQTTSETRAGITEVIGGVASIGVGIASLVATGGATAPAVATGIAGIVGGTTAIADGVATSFKETTSSKGGQGGFARARQTITHSNMMSIRLTLYSHIYSCEPISIQSTNGVPVMAIHTLSDFNGYVKCSGASVDINGNEEEKTKINNYLNNSGVFIE